MRILINKANTLTLIKYKKKTTSEFEKALISLIIDDYSRDLDTLQKICGLLEKYPFMYILDYLLLDLEFN